ncbi:Probable LRR receptor-like serine/threonine-protein kinase At3g47570, partial [Linum perenne]
SLSQPHSSSCCNGLTTFPFISSLLSLSHTLQFIKAKTTLFLLQKSSFFFSTFEVQILNSSLGLALEQISEPMGVMGKNVFLFGFTFILLFASNGVSSAPLVSPARIVSSIFSNTLPAFIKWVWSLKASTKTAMSGRPLMKFESGYTVETMFDGSRAGIDPYSVEVLPSGELLVLDSANSNLYKMPSSLSLYSKPELVAGSGEGYSGYVDGKPGEAKMNHPKGVAADDRGNIYVADTMNNAIRKIRVTTIAGGKRGNGGGSHVDGASEDAKFSNDFDVVYMGSSCSLLVIDRGNKAIREIQLHFDDCAYQYESGFPLDYIPKDTICLLFSTEIALLLAAGLFGYMLAFLQRRMVTMVSSHRGVMMAETQAPKPLKSALPPLMPTGYDHQDKQSEETSLASLWKLFTIMATSFMEIIGLRKNSPALSHQYQNQHQGWPLQDSYVIPDEDEPPTFEAKTPTPRKKTYAFMSKDAEKMQRWRQGRSFYHPRQQHSPQQQPNQQQYQSTSPVAPYTYYEQSHEETNEIVFGAVQELGGKAKPSVIKAVDYGDPMFDRYNIRVRSSSARYGTIPFSIGKLRSLERLYLHENNISGYIPSSIGNLTKLYELSISDNYLDGEIPASIQGCQRLSTLDLSNNNLTGVIPPEVMGLTSLSVALDLSENKLTGALPVEVGNLKNLALLDLSHNMLSDDIPNSLESCVSLESLHLEDNLLQGIIPSALRSLRGLQELDLSANNLSGQVPVFLEQMNISKLLNLSYNNFEGEVPERGVFKNSTIISVVGNSKLCGGIVELKLPPCNSTRRSNKRLSNKWKIVISTISVLLFLACMGSCLFIFRNRKRRKQDVVSANDDLLLQLSYQRLYKATDGFASTNLIGQGSFGSVYKGVLDDKGVSINIAVKVLNLQRSGASKSFHAECEALKNIRHKNLVKIVTVCSGVDRQGNDFKAIIYELMANGSLDDWLHPDVEIDEPTITRSLNFRQRVNIATDVAFAMDYLHNQCSIPVVHCDLKPSNVLLDEDMVAHVSDFGLARFLSPVENPSSSSIGIKGTVGYAPPGNDCSLR